MRYFVCLVRVSGAPVTTADRRLIVGHLASRGIDQTPDWEEAGSLCALVRRPGESGPRVARVGSAVAAGDVRLDNPGALASRLSLRQAPVADLDLALHATLAQGTEAASEMLGDFAYVAWDAATRRLIAVRDPFGVKPLFHAKLLPDLLAFSSHASLLGTSGSMNDAYIARYFVRSVSEEDAIFDGVGVVPAAHTLTVTDGRWAVRRYWCPKRFQIDATRPALQTVEECRTLFMDSVRLRLAGRDRVWCELSGGLDTSAIVSTAVVLQRSGASQRGLSGTMTYADSFGSGDESEFVDAVVRATGLPNAQVHDSWPWRNDGGGPLRTEQPGPGTLFWFRDRERNERLHDAGAYVLLSGLGGDHLFEGNLHFFADRLAARAIGRTCREMAHWAAVQQRSFWTFAFRHGLAPLLPAVQARLTSRRSHMRIPAWVAHGFRRRADLDACLERTTRPRLTDGALPRYRAESVDLVDGLPRSMPRHQPFVPYERRFPFLYRPLVELSLRLRPELKVSPGAGKTTLREAMRGVLPEPVRTRLGKGGVNMRMLWSLNHEHRLIERMLRDPILAEMGYVEPAPLRDAYHGARTGREGLTVPLFNTLALETWMLIETGRWSRLEGIGLKTRNTTKKENSHANDQEAVPEARADRPGFRGDQDDGDEQRRMLGRQSDQRQRQPEEVLGGSR